MTMPEARTWSSLAAGQPGCERPRCSSAAASLAAYHGSGGRIYQQYSFRGGGLARSAQALYGFEPIRPAISMRPSAHREKVIIGPMPLAFDLIDNDFACAGRRAH